MCPGLNWMVWLKRRFQCRLSFFGTQLKWEDWNRSGRLFLPPLSSACVRPCTSQPLPTLPSTRWGPAAPPPFSSSRNPVQGLCICLQPGAISHPGPRSPCAFRTLRTRLKCPPPRASPSLSAARSVRGAPSRHRFTFPTGTGKRSGPVCLSVFLRLGPSPSPRRDCGWSSAEITKLMGCRHALPPMGEFGPTSLVLGPRSLLPDPRDKMGRDHASVPVQLPAGQRGSGTGSDAATSASTAAALPGRKKGGGALGLQVESGFCSGFLRRACGPRAAGVVARGGAPAAGPLGCTWRPFLRGRSRPRRAGTRGLCAKGGRVGPRAAPPPARHARPRALRGGGGRGRAARRSGDKRESAPEAPSAGARHGPAEPRAPGKRRVVGQHCVPGSGSGGSAERPS